jgi:hypothetical protein
VLVLGSVHVGAQLVGGGPEGLFDVVQHAQNLQNDGLIMRARIVDATL